MIVVTRLNDSAFAINPDLIERITENPDTTLVMVDGAKYIVRETMAEVIDLVAQYRSRIVSLAYLDEGEHGQHGAQGQHGQHGSHGSHGDKPTPPAGRLLELVPEREGR